MQKSSTDRSTSHEGYSFDVFLTYSRLAIRIGTREEFVKYILHQTASFCDACINDGNFVRPLLRIWFMREGAQQYVKSMYIYFQIPNLLVSGRVSAC